MRTPDNQTPTKIGTAGDENKHDDKTQDWYALTEACRDRFTLVLMIVTSEGLGGAKEQIKNKQTKKGSEEHQDLKQETVK